MLDTLATEVYAHTAMFNVHVQGLLQCVCVCVGYWWEG